MGDRLDKIMVAKGLVKTRSQARMLINQGDVVCDGAVITKPGKIVANECEIQIKQDQLYVSRGAYKLKRALVEFNLDMRDLVIADIGASTGGFTQVCLEEGVRKVYAVDVGHDQLSDILKNDERVLNLEGINVKEGLQLDELVDGFVCDVSFISIKSILLNVKKNLKKDAFGVLLIKPQFEAGRARLPNDGVIKSAQTREEIVKEVKDWLEKNGFKLNSIIESPIQGKTGNIEYLASLST